MILRAIFKAHFDILRPVVDKHTISIDMAKSGSRGKALSEKPCQKSPGR